MPDTRSITAKTMPVVVSSGCEPGWGAGRRKKELGEDEAWRKRVDGGGRRGADRKRGWEDIAMRPVGVRPWVEVAARMVLEVPAASRNTTVYRVQRPAWHRCRVWYAGRSPATRGIGNERGDLAEKLVRANGGRSRGSISKVRRDVEFPLAAHFHQLQGFSPTLNHLPHSKLSRLAPFEGAIELFSIDQGSTVVNGNGIRR